MTYRSEDAAIEAELAQLESERASVQEKLERIQGAVDVRRAFARWRRLLGPALGLFVLGVLAAGFAQAAKRRAETQHAAEQRRLEEKIQGYEARLDQLRRVRQIAEAGKPLMKVLGSLGAADDPKLFEAIRGTDPRTESDAWWIVVHGGCRAYPKEPVDEQTLGNLDAERRERARAFCAGGRENP